MALPLGPALTTLSNLQVKGLMLVPGTGLEPARLAALDPKSSASANSAIPAIRYDNLQNSWGQVSAPDLVVRPYDFTLTRDIVAQLPYLSGFGLDARRPGLE